MLIAEIGNNHFGSMSKAKELIRIAHESGADIIKGQAFHARFITNGSMPKSFYKMCQFSIDEYLELIAYARSIGNDLFYSIFCGSFEKGFKKIKMFQNWHKISGNQTKLGYAKSENDYDNIIVSVPEDFTIDKIPKFKKTEILFVSKYLEQDPDLELITVFKDYLKRPVGYSDHTIGIDACLKAYNDLGSIIIEKHFTLEKNMTFCGKIFRDTVHGSDPKEFEKLANIMKG